MKYPHLSLLMVLLSISLFSCQPNTEEELYKAAAFSEGGVQAVIEIPAGTNHKIEFNPATKQFENDQLEGKDRIINFLPYPGNYGFIPSTHMDTERGGDGDALDVLVIAESMKTGSKIAVIPIAALDIRDKGAVDTKIIAIPADSSLQIVRAQNFRSFVVEYSAAKQIIEQWFLNYKGLVDVELIAWRNEQVAMAEIKKWLIKDQTNQATEN